MPSSERSEDPRRGSHLRVSSNLPTTKGTCYTLKSPTHERTDLRANHPEPFTVPAPPAPAPRRIPNFLHLLIFLAIAFFSLIFCEGVLLALHTHTILETLQDQRLQLFTNIAIYAVALAAAALILPLLWHKSFLTGISWNSPRVRVALIPVGLFLGVLSQASSTFLPHPKKTPIEAIFKTPGIIWVLALFGTFIAPLFEEIVFRGFLLPAIAIAVDYFRLPKSLDALAAWRSSDTFSRPALITSVLITSLCFAGIHAPQLGFSWPSVALLLAVSLVLCYIRIRFHSVAASTVVHCSYNFSVFLTLFIGTGGFRHMDKL